MSKPTIHITIEPDGTVTIAPSGFKGGKCKQATKPFEDALGLDGGNSKPTAEMYQTEEVKIGQRT